LRGDHQDVSPDDRGKGLVWSVEATVGCPRF
jgi:hypothetical protein